MYAPYLLIDQYQVAFKAGILPHYVQYHGIFWLVGPMTIAMLISNTIDAARS